MSLPSYIKNYKSPVLSCRCLERELLVSVAIARSRVLFVAHGCVNVKQRKEVKNSPILIFVFY